MHISPPLESHLMKEYFTPNKSQIEDKSKLLVSKVRLTLCHEKK